MKHNTQFIRDFMDSYGYPEEAKTEFTRVLERLDADSAFASAFNGAVARYKVPDGETRIGEVLEDVTRVAQDFGENEYTMHFVTLLVFAEPLKRAYEKAGIPDGIYRDSMDDLRCKLNECIKCKEVPGTFVGGWFDGMYKLNRFALGRFQFEPATYDFYFDFTTSCGKKLTRGDFTVNFHIPSSGIPLTDEVRFDSYRRAYEFFRDRFPDGLAVFRCGSWLLYPRHREFLPANSNILRFMDDFETVCWEEKKGFPNDWRVFDKYADLPYDQLPRDTSLRRAYADWLLAGNNGGDATGVIVFDGEKIVR